MVPHNSDLFGSSRGFHQRCMSDDRYFGGLLMIGAFGTSALCGAATRLILNIPYEYIAGRNRYHEA